MLRNATTAKIILLKKKHPSLWKSAEDDVNFFLGFFDEKGNLNKFGEKHRYDCMQPKK